MLFALQQAIPGRANVKRMWIAGKEGSLESRHTRLYEKYVMGVGDGLLSVTPDGLFYVGGLLDSWRAVRPPYYSIQPAIIARQAKRHNAKVNMWFCDGHVEYI